MPALAVFWAAAPDTKAGTKCKTAKRALKPASVLRIRFGFTAMQVPVRAYAPRGTGRRRFAASARPPWGNDGRFGKRSRRFQTNSDGFAAGVYGWEVRFCEWRVCTAEQTYFKNSVYNAVSRFNWIYGFTPFFMMSNTAAV